MLARAFCAKTVVRDANRNSPSPSKRAPDLPMSNYHTMMYALTQRCQLADEGKPRVGGRLALSGLFSPWRVLGLSQEGAAMQPLTTSTPNLPPGHFPFSVQ